MHDFLRTGAMALGIAGLATAASAATQTFDTPVTITASQAPVAGAWYVDRYAPAGFASPVLFAGDNRLKQSISAADGLNTRPPAFQSNFYNTQGRKFDLGAGVRHLAIDLYVPGDWATSGRRMAGLWGTGFDATNTVSAFPIVEFASLDGTPRFRLFDGSVGFVDIGLPTGFAFDSFTRLDIRLSGNSFVYRIGDLTASAGANGSTSIGNVILQGHNNLAGVSYDIYWDNLTNSVPEPGSWALMILGFGLVGASMRRATSSGRPARG